MLLRFGRLAWRFGQGCFLAKTGPRGSREFVRRWRGASGETEILRGRLPLPGLGSGEAWSSPSNGPIPGLVAPIRPLQLCADGGYQLRIRSLEGTPNYGPRQTWCGVVVEGVICKLQWSTRDVRSEMNSDDLICAPCALNFMCTRYVLLFWYLLLDERVDSWFRRCLISSG
jgi:hypothetical protein